MSLVLFIDDDLNLLQSTVTVLQEVSDCEIKGFSNAKDALVFMENNRPDLIVCDLLMPGIDGQEFFMILKEKKELTGIPFIIITGNNFVENRLKLLELGVHDYINKPFSYKELNFKINNLLKLKQNILESSTHELFNIKKLRSEDEKFFRKLNDFLKNHVQSDIDYSKLATYCNVSKSTLEKRVKKYCEVNLSTYVRNYRLEYSIQLIRSGLTNVKALAYNSGFNSVAYFSKSFKKYKGLGPKKYIEKNYEAPENM